MSSTSSTATPIRKRQLLDNSVIIPPSPFMKRLGFGTGVSVYKLNRSPVSSQVRSPWAIKKLTKLKFSETLSTRIKEEASILKKLNHPNVVGFRALTSDIHGKLCLAMEACTTSLGNLIETREEDILSPFPPGNIATVINDIAKALNYLHNEAYILHCDIKSYNVLIQGNFEICKLCDFGVSLPLKCDGTVDSQLLKYACLGTGPWMAPEAVIDGIVSVKSDVYSFGLVIWEMIALTIPPQQEDIGVDLLETSELDSSNVSIESGVHSFKSIDWRPELPAEDFSEDYDIILELFYCCTEKNAEFRPSANLLVEVSCEILKKLSPN